MPFKELGIKFYAGIKGDNYDIALVVNDFSNLLDLRDYSFSE